MTKRKYNTMRKFRLDEISGVDSPAQAGARVVLRKRDTKMQKDYQNPVMLSDVDGHSHILDASGRGGETSYDKMPGEEYGHSHPWIMSLDGGISIGAANGHTHSVLAMKRQPTGDTTVTDPKTPTVEQLAKQLADSQSELAVSKFLASLNDSEKVHYSGLNDAGKTEFVKLDASGRKAEISKATESNAVVYKSEKGVEFRKNDDPRLVEMAKELDAETKVRKGNDEKLARTVLEKRAETEMPKLPGDADVKCAVLKALDGISDDKLRTGAMALIKAGHDAIKGAFNTVGTSSAPAGDESPVQQMDRLAKACAAEKKIPYVDAYEAVGKQDPALLAKAINHKA